MDQEVSDPSLIRRWAKICDEKHIGKCFAAPGPKERHIVLATSLRLIDVENGCLVTIEAGAALPIFVSLSYVWGKCRALHCTTTNIDDLHVPNSLLSGRYAQDLAKTIKDAMLFLKGVGIRYLWADMLCICQDSPDDKLLRLPEMASLYGNSYFTIIAADGLDAQAGIIGSNSSNPRRPNSTLVSFNGRITLRTVPRLEKDRLKKWHERAWTLQERVLSRRAVIFLDEGVRWQCLSDSFDERNEANMEENLCICQGGQMNEEYCIEQRLWPDLEKYSSLVKDYTQRNLSDPNDGLNAFSGIITALSEFFPSGFYQGLPEFFFDIALLWQFNNPKSQNVPQRRCALAEGNLSSRFASWSWAGWTHTDGVAYWDVLVDYDYPICFRTSPVAKWYRPDGHGNWTEIRNDYHLYRNSATQSSSELWGRWTKQARSHYSDRYYFKHPSVHDPLGRFEYPLPVADVPYNVEIRPDVSRIKLETTVCKMQFSRELRIGSRVRETPFPTLRTMDGWFAGILDDYVCLYSDDDSNQIECELIAISRGSTRNMDVSQSDWLLNTLSEVEYILDGYDIKKYQWYNVMCIRWEDGIAYRMGMGRVYKPIWDSQQLETKTIVLG
jgi:hypothetical protein